VSRPLRLLLIEDDPDDAELVCLELEAGGYAIESRRVWTETEFLEALEASTWDLIVSDYSMPGFDGLRAFDLYREWGQDVPFIFVSGALGEERAVRAMRLGAKDYLLKGKLGRLVAAVQRELEERHNRRLRAEAERERIRQQQRLAVAVRASGTGVFEVTERGEPFFSARFAEILGYEPEALPSDVLSTHVHPSEQALRARSWEAFLSGESDSYRQELRLRHTDGESRSVLLCADAAARSQEGRVTHAVGVMVDLTERKLLEARAREAAKFEAVSRLASGLAHDFNNMLSVVLGYAEIAEEALGPTTPVRKHLRLIREAGTRAADLAGQLLAYSRRQVLEPTTLCPRELLETVAALVVPIAGESIDVCLRLEKSRMIRVDPGQLEQALVNLAVNACDAMPGDGALTFTLTEEEIGDALALELELDPGSYVLLRVEDTGSGIDRETLAKAFEPFFTTKAPGKGTGLGLASVHGFIRQSHGAIRLSSKPGEGTCVDLLLPVAESDRSSEVAPSTQPTKPGVGGASANVLVVEESELVRELIREVLEGMGYRVVVAESGEEGLRLWGESDLALDLLVTDQVLPDLDGAALAQRVRATQPNARVLFISGCAPEDSAVPTGDAVLPLPVKPRELRDTTLVLLRDLWDSGQTDDGEGG